jgi:hypothetical protein
LFDLPFDLLLYDVTSTYFEGQCQGNPKAQRGYSRDSRSDCPQVCIGLIVTEEGIPLGYEVFAGNTHDSKTIPDIVAAMEAKYGQAQRIWVLDRGMVSEKNLEFLRDRGGQYIVGTPKAMLRKIESALAEGAWHTVQEGVEVKLVAGPDGVEAFVLARSADRREKEKRCTSVLWSDWKQLCTSSAWRPRGVASATPRSPTVASAGCCNVTSVRRRSR